MIDPHSTDGVHVPCRPGRSEGDVEHFHGLGHVAQGQGADAVDGMALAPGGFGDLAGGEYLAAGRASGDPCGEVDRSSEYVAVSFDGRPVVESGPGEGKS